MVAGPAHFALSPQLVVDLAELDCAQPALQLEWRSTLVTALLTILHTVWNFTVAASSMKIPLHFTHSPEIPYFSHLAICLMQPPLGPTMNPLLQPSHLSGAGSTHFPSLSLYSESQITHCPFRVSKQCSIVHLPFFRMYGVLQI